MARSTAKTPAKNASSKKMSPTKLRDSGEYLAARLDLLKALLTGLRDGTPHADLDEAFERGANGLEESAAALPEAPRLLTLSELLGLGPFEENVLLLALGIELEPEFRALWGEIGLADGGDATHGVDLTLGAVMGLLPDADWAALTPTGPLRYWGLIEVGPGVGLLASPIRIDERVLWYLVGLDHLDERLMRLASPIDPGPALAPSQARLSKEIAAVWVQGAEAGRPPVVVLTGGGQGAKRAIARVAADLVGVRLWEIGADALRLDAADTSKLARLWDRESLLSQSGLFLEADAFGPVPDDPSLPRSFQSFAAAFHGPLIVACSDGRSAPPGAVVFDVEPPTIDEQRAIWCEVIGDAVDGDGPADHLSYQFDLDGEGIRAAHTHAVAMLEADPDGISLADALWEACRTHGRATLDHLVSRIEPRASWDDLVLPADRLAELRDLADQIRHRPTVYGTWAFARRESRGLGIAALFAGESGTGKTLAAEVLAADLGLDLYRIDLSAVVSKYIGETEKNLRRIFDVAQAAGAVLLFDEADALFGKRTEVRDSHDRHANIEVSYLLQRLESYRGLAILTTNLKESLDSAFLRRLRFVVQFPFPDARARARIWEVVLNDTAPLDGIDPAKLAQLNVAGGNIRNIAINAAFLAAAEGGDLGADHILAAARREYTKLDRTLTDTETRGWS